MEPFETFEHAGLTVELHQDTDAGDPFEEMDQAAELVWLNREQAYKNVNGHVSLDHDHYLDPDRLTSVAHGARYLTLMRGYLVAIPFEFYDYGSGGYRTSLVSIDSDRAAGFVCVSPKGIEVTGAPDPLEAAKQDFEVWRAWVEGEVSGYVVENAEGEVLDSCWGFYGELDYVRKEAKEAAEYEAHEIAVNLEPLDVAEVLARA
jgi:hypothetical protein